MWTSETARRYPKRADYPDLARQTIVKVGWDGQYEEIARGIHREEYERALALARELGLRLDARSVDERHRLAHAR
jgi:uncharacterized Fe-S radical SAM superfamily protein PflX